MSSQTQRDRAEQSAEQRRRKRRERAAKSRTPEPKNIVSGAGQPLDPGVRRELEEQLGHDLGRVRLHTGRDAGRLTELLGADAVAVGQDVFFREGMFKPGTDEGRRLLAHELLHTVQNPHGLGTLRAGRELGAVSLPQQAIEREAEGAAQELVREPGQDAPQVEEGQATPGWLRYATVHADRGRAEQMDPATLVDRLTNTIVRSLRGDPQDLSLRTRKQLSRLPQEMLDAVLVRLERRLLSSEHERVLDLVDEIEAYDDYADDDLERNAHDAPQMEPDTAEEVRAEREEEQRKAEERRAERQRPGQVPGPEKEQSGDEGEAGSTPRNGGTPEQRTTPEGGAAPREAERDSRPPGAPGGRTGRKTSGAPAAPREQASSAAGSGGKPEGGQQGGQRADGQKSASSAEGKEQKQDPDGKEDTEQRETPAASKEESAARNRPGAAEAAVAGRQVKPEDRQGQQKPTGTPARTGQDTQLPGRRSTLEGKRSQDLEGLQEEKDEDPFASGGESEVEVGGEEPSAWDIKLRPEDFLPRQDLDVSGVPTAEELDPSASPSMPSFPAPPPTRADEVRALRDAEDAEDAAAEAEPAEETAGEPLEVTPSKETEGGPDSATGLGGLALEQAAAMPPVPRTASKDPKSGDDPKAGPVAAQTTVQEAPGTADGKSEGGSDVGETAAKEEAGTPAGGDKTTAAPEKESQQAAGGSSAQSDAGTKGGAGPEGSGASGTSGAAPAPDTAGDTGGTSGSSSGTVPTPGPAPDTSPGPSDRTDVPPAAPRSEPAPSQPASAPAPKAAPEPKRAPETAPERRAAAPSAGRSRGGGGGGGGGRGGGGGGGGAAAPARGKGKKDSGPAPNLAGVSPEAGLATASNLKPHPALEAMGGVGGAVDRSVGDEHRTLASAPPEMQRPAGAPRTLQGKPRTDAPAQYSQDPAQQAAEPEREDAEVEGAKEPEGQIEAEKAEEPGAWDSFAMALGFIGGKLVNGVASIFGADKPVVDPQELAAKFAGLPTKDEALKQAQAGNAPGVQMQGVAGQAAGEQDGHVDAKGRQTLGTARDDAGRGMGEDQVYPDAPKEQLTAKVPGGKGGAGQGVGSGGVTGAVPAEAASEVAEHERGSQFRAAFSEGQKGMSESRQAKDRDFRDSQAKHRQQVDAEIATNTRTQAGEREKAMAEVTAQREDWRADQDQELKSLGDKKSDRRDKVEKDVRDQEKQTDDKVETEKEDSDKKIEDEAVRAERDADQQKNTAAEQSGNWITKAFDWIKQKVIEIKNAIVRVIRAARDAVIGFIRTFKETVERWINEARKNIVDAIKNFIKDLIEFAKAMVRAVIDLAKRVRNLITTLIQAAIALVNRLSQMLKQMITDLLNALGKLLSSILDILKKALLDVIKAVVDTVKGILQFAAGLLSALGDFMLIAVDFLSDPGGWLSGAKNSAVDGAKNHLFREVKSAVKEWFQSKIEEILGIPKAVFDKLLKGGITLEQIVKETWDAIVPQLPLIIGEIVITKVIAKLIPGAGWVMAVIDAIRTAIGALGEILRAMGAVLDWLKAVRTGGAGILFAKAVAAGIVALLELAYEALLSGIGKYVAKVGRRFKDIAARLGRGEKNRDGDRRPGAPEVDDRRGDKDARSTAGNEGGAASPAMPKSGKGVEPGTKPQGKAAPTKPATRTPGKDTSGKPKRGGQDLPGRSKDQEPNRPGRLRGDKDGSVKPGTRPTPAPKPKPKPDPQPTLDQDAKPTPKDKLPEQFKDGKEVSDTTKPKGDRSIPGKTNDVDPVNPRNDDKDTTGKPGGHGSTKPKGPDREDRDGGSRKPQGGSSGPGRPAPRVTRPKGRTKGPDRRGPRPDTRESGRPGRPKSDSDKVRTRKHENSRDFKDDRLRRIVAAIRPRLYNAMRDGIPQSTFLGLLKSMRLYYRLTGLGPVGGDPFTVVASLNPSRPVLGGDYSEPRSQPSAYPNPPGAPAPAADLPTPKMPSYSGDRASHIAPEYISQPKITKGTPASRTPAGEPKGWDYITDPSRNLQEDGAWVRAHLLPDRLGGDARGSNLVPARRGVNKDLELGVEMPAWRAAKNKPIWYESRVEFGNTGAVADIPTFIRSTFGRYEKIRGTGAKQTDWKELGAEKTVQLNLKPPQADEKNVLYINTFGATQIKSWLNITMGMANHIVKQRLTLPGRQYRGMLHLELQLRARKRSLGPRSLPQLSRALERLKMLEGARLIDWNLLHEEV
ncbi:DUF4157 domain-containing protein [Streptomyces sp. NPDC052687]|uniref:eCIS core domain-containing protein n=1 Tax=Streptomyces sp. NPDC052687 TaxID=3154759 RepID=UPI003414AAAE